MSSRGSSVLRYPSDPGSQAKPINIIEVLGYMKRCFDDEIVLDTLPLEAAGNAGAWKAWRAYRRSTNLVIDNVTLENSTKRQDEWSWDGVWEERVRKGIDASITESTLYGNTAGGGDDVVRRRYLFGFEQC